MAAEHSIITDELRAIVSEVPERRTRSGMSCTCSDVVGSDNLGIGTNWGKHYDNCLFRRTLG